MVLREARAARVRRWVAAVVGLGLGLGVVACYFAAQDRTVYWSRAEVVFLAPSSERYPNSLSTTSGDLVNTAGIIWKRITGADKVSKYASPDVTLIGTGVRQGWSIRLPDSGGQWASNFASQTLVVEVVDPDRGVVQEKLDQLVGRIADELDTVQRDAGVSPVNHITTKLAPESMQIYEIRGSRPRAVGMTALLSGAATFAGAALVRGRGLRGARPNGPSAASGAGGRTTVAAAHPR